MAATCSGGYTAPDGLSGLTNSSTFVRGVHACVELLDGDLEPGLDRRVDDLRHAAGEGDRLRVGRPVRRRADHLVAGIAQRGERREHGVLAAVGDEHLAGRAVEAAVALGLVGDGLAELGQAAGRRVAVVLGVAAGRDGGLDDVLGRREVGLAGAEADDRHALRLQRLGLGVDGQGGGLGDGGEAPGHAAEFGRWHGHPLRKRQDPVPCCHSDRAAPTALRLPTSCCRPTDASAAGPSKVRAEQVDALVAAGTTRARHVPPPATRQAARGLDPRRPGRAVRPARQGGRSCSATGARPCSGTSPRSASSTGAASTSCSASSRRSSPTPAPPRPTSTTR